MLPAGVSIKAIFDQSVFVNAALDSVLMGGLMAAGLTALMILMFLGNWRLTLIILASIPLSVITAVLVMGAAGETLNTMTLGGFALAVGILVDNGTVVIENIERHVGMGAPLEQAIIEGAGEVGTPTFLATLCICIVFVPVFLLQGTAKYLFSPLSVSVIVALLASLVLSFTLVPALFKYLMHSVHAAGNAHPAAAQAAPHPLHRVHLAFERGFRPLPRGVSRRAFLGGRACQAHGTRVSRAHGALLHALPAAGARFLSRGRCRADASARARAPRHTHRDDGGVFCAGGGGYPTSGRRGAGCRHPRQHRSALQRHQHRAERLGDGGADGR